MKNIFNIFLLGCFIMLVSCSQQTFEPRHSDNPWADNYASVAKMQDYKQWGTYNVHDPSCLLVGDTYYMYSTDAIYKEDSISIKEKNLSFGYIQVRRSKDLINWEFVGWAFPEIPQEAKEWVLSNSGGVGANNIWAPYIFEYKGNYRLYYSVSAFAKQTSYIGMAESATPEGPWELKGCVVKTKTGDIMNAIDPSVVTNPETGEQWMHYGSYFGGLHCVLLNPESGLTMVEGDQGQLTARRFDGKKNNIEAPEIIYNPDLKQYFLFVSYDPLMTTYNVRVGRSENPEGPFYDFFGKDMREESDDFPILTYPYQFENHPGWAGTAHCCVFQSEDGKYFMAHQARLRPDNHMMDLHVREIYWTEDGWPVVSPERYASTSQQPLQEADLIGEWEIIEFKGNTPDRELKAGQILWGENHLNKDEEIKSRKISFDNKGEIKDSSYGNWSFNGEKLIIESEENILKLNVFMGHDWENQTQTILFSGLDNQGCSIWGKRIK